LKDGKPSTYSEQSVLEAPTLKDLTRIVHDAMAALNRPVLSDFPDQECYDMKAVTEQWRALRKQSSD